MSQEDIQTLIAKLREEVVRLESNSEAYNEINSLIVDIEHQLELDDLSLTERMRCYIEKIEAEHPRITSILSEIMNKLINIGV